MRAKNFATSAIFALPFWMCQAAFAQRVAIDAALRGTDKPFVQATGQATLSVPPDQAVIDIGVVCEGATAADVAAQNATQTDALIVALKRVLNGANQLQTIGYSLRPNYQFPKPGATAKIAGYTATNTVEVTLDDLSKVGKVIDAATQSGANQIQKLHYQLKKADAVHARALREASAQAKANAEAIAAGLSLTIARVLSAEEVVPGDGSVMYRQAPLMGREAISTPIEVETIEVSVTVTVRAEIAQ